MPASPPHNAHWRSETIAGVTVRVFEPAASPVGVVVVLPDFEWPDAQALDQLAARLNESAVAAVMPETRAWWIDRPEPAFPGRTSSLDFIIRDIVPWAIGSRPGLQLAAFGIGFGGQGAFQLAYRHPQTFPIAAAVSPAIDFHRLYDSSPQLREWFESLERARQETVTLRLHPLNWPPHQWFACPRGDWRFDGCERLASKLRSVGIPFTADLETPHGPEYQTKQIDRAARFLADRLKEPPVNRDIRTRR